MKLNDPNFIGFDGTPVTGRAPPQLRVEGGRELTQQQFGAVMHAYKLFRDALRVTPSPFLVQNRTFVDGTRVRMESMQDRDIVYVWPVGGEVGTKLPHGFAVSTNWHRPRIYRRDLNDGVQWLLGPSAPQISSHTADHYDNQAFRKNIAADKFLNVPHVRDHWNPSLWDYKRHGAPSVSATPVVPLLLKNTTTGAFLFESPHYASGGKLIDATGATLYTMADEAPILVPEHPDYPESVHQRAGITDAQGNQIALQAMRFTVISPTFNIWKFRFWNERINRTDDSTYALVERAATEFTTPWGHQTVTTTSINDNSLGEDPALLFKFKATSAMKPGGYHSSGLWNGHFGWSGPDAWSDITGVTIRGSDNQSLRQIKEQGAGVATYDKLIATAGATETGHIQIERRLNYPAKVFWRGGSHHKWSWTEDVAELLLGSKFATLPYNYRVIDAAITRYNTEYDVDGVPTITAKLGWIDLLLLEGTTTGRMSGKEYINQLGQVGVYAWTDSSFSWSNFYITQEIKHLTDFPYSPSGDPYPGYTAWADAANVKSLYWEDYLAHGTGSSYLGGPPPQPAIKYEYPFNIRPSNIVSYDLKSRYVIDFDQKGRFYAAIRCEVTATGAAWKENIAVYKGFMEKDTDPTYTVKIWFECEWDGVFAQQLLAEESVTRPMFEAITVSQFNPWYWPFPAYIDRDCKVRTPPEPTPDENFMMMFANLAGHQGVNPNLCCADVRPDIIGTDAERTYSKGGAEYSYENNGVVIPHQKYVTGQLYARTFKLSDFNEALWMLYQLKVDATEENTPAEEYPRWFYHPVIKAALDVNRHIEVRDGGITQWSDNIPTPVTGFPPTPEPHPAPTDRIIKLNRV